MKFDIRKYRRLYCADFETSTDKWNVEKARVWLWDICDSNYNHTSGNCLDTFMEHILNNPVNYLYSFRNLAYDGVYILSWLLSNGYKHILGAKPEKMPPHTFTTVISDVGQHYAYMISNKHGNKVTIFDSLKYVNMSIEKSAENYDLPIKKGHIDYDEVREEGHIPTDEELDYIHNDTEIDMRTIQLNMVEGAVKFTQAGNARNEFYKTFTDGEIDCLFPEIELATDKYLRRAYFGGYVMPNSKRKNQVLSNMISLDINSMYPAQMLHRPMPYGEPMYYLGQYDEQSKWFRDKFPLYVQRFSCVFSIKENGIPTIATKRFYSSPDKTYLEDSGGKIIELTLSNPDLELFLANYNVLDIEYIDGYAFAMQKGYEVTPEEASRMSVDEVIELDGKGSYFYEYIKKWRYIKEHAKKHSPSRDYAKRMQNALYGALATNPCRRSSIPYLDEKGILRYNISASSSDGSSVYLPAGIFITAWARYFLITNIMKYRELFVYCDTDSLYLLGDTPPKDAPIHNSLYGFFKVEHLISKFKVVGAKRYIYKGREPDETDESFYVTCCGADEDIKKQITFENFELGAIFEGKKSVHNVVGGKHIYITTYRLGKKIIV